MSVDLILLLIAVACFVVAILAELGVLSAKPLALIAGGLLAWVLTAIV